MDIVERLRELSTWDMPELKYAADEIERLRDELEFTDEVRQSALQSLLSAENEIERLRSKVWALLNELQRIADVSERWEDSLVFQINEMAHKALEEKNTKNLTN